MFYYGFFHVILVETRFIINKTLFTTVVFDLNAYYISFKSLQERNHQDKYKRHTIFDIKLVVIYKIKTTY